MSAELLEYQLHRFCAVGAYRVRVCQGRNSRWGTKHRTVLFLLAAYLLEHAGKILIDL